jgi:hypothetical protein
MGMVGIEARPHQKRDQQSSQSEIGNRKSEITMAALPFSPLKLPSQDIEKILVAGFDQLQSDG